MNWDYTRRARREHLLDGVTQLATLLSVLVWGWIFIVSMWILLGE